MRMALNGVYIVQGESSAVVALLRRAPATANQSAFLRSFADLYEVLTTVWELSDVAPAVLLAPFLDVVRSALTNGPVTAAALSSVGKLLSYGLIDPNDITAASAVDSIADAVTHARFTGGVDEDGDEAVLLRTVQVLRTLLLAPIGRLLSNESICEMMQSCFRICFETRLSDLLRKTADSTIADMIQLLFKRLPTFTEIPHMSAVSNLEFRITTGALDWFCSYKTNNKKKKSKRLHTAGASTKVSTVQGCLDILGADSNDSLQNGLSMSFEQQEVLPNASKTSVSVPQFEEASTNVKQEPFAFVTEDVPSTLLGSRDSGQIYLNLPYGVPCVRELLRFLIALTDSHDPQNTEAMVLMALNWLIVALETGADHLGTCTLLMSLIRNEICGSLLALIGTDKLQVFGAASRVCFLLFESLRTHLKFQLQTHFQKLMEIVSSEQARISCEQKEMALECLVQMWRIPGLATELYLNYDCDLYCSNLFEDLTNELSRSAVTANIPSSSIQSMSLEALLMLVDQLHSCTTISSNDGACGVEAPRQGLRPNRHPPSSNIPSYEELTHRKQQKQQQEQQKVQMTDVRNEFMHAPVGYIDGELFVVVWRPVVRALSSLLRRDEEITDRHKLLDGVRKCAEIANHCSMSDVFASLMLQLTTTTEKDQQASPSSFISLPDPDKVLLTSKRKETVDCSRCNVCGFVPVHSKNKPTTSHMRSHHAVHLARDFKIFRYVCKAGGCMFTSSQSGNQSKHRKVFKGHLVEDRLALIEEYCRKFIDGRSATEYQIEVKKAAATGVAFDEDLTSLSSIQFWLQNKPPAPSMFSSDDDEDEQPYQGPSRSTLNRCQCNVCGFVPGFASTTSNMRNHHRVHLARDFMIFRFVCKTMGCDYKSSHCGNRSQHRLCHPDHEIVRLWWRRCVEGLSTIGRLANIKLKWRKRQLQEQYVECLVEGGGIQLALLPLGLQAFGMNLTSLSATKFWLDHHSPKRKRPHMNRQTSTKPIKQCSRANQKRSEDLVASSFESLSASSSTEKAQVLRIIKMELMPEAEYSDMQTGLDV